MTDNLYEPCTVCGGTTFVQKTVQLETVHTDGAGEIEEIEPRSDSFQVVELWCAECDSLLFDTADQVEVC